MAASRFLGLDDIYADSNLIEDVKASIFAALVFGVPLHAWCPVDAYVSMLRHPKLEQFTAEQVDERMRDLLDDTDWPTDVRAALLAEWRETGKMGGVMVHVSSDEGVSLEMVPELDEEGSEQ